jgi:hypothetical protein
MCLDNRSLCWLLTTQQGPELHLDVSRLQYINLYSSWMCLHYRTWCIYTMAWASPWSAWTTGACAGLDVSTSQGAQGAELHLDMSGQHRRVLSCTWTCLHHRGLSCTYTYLDNNSLCWFVCVYITGGFTAPIRFWTKGACAGLDMSTSQWPELHTYLDNKSLCWFVCVYITGCWAASGRVYTKEACAAPEHVNITHAYAAPGCVWTTGAFADYTTGAWAALGLIYTVQWPVLHLNVYTVAFMNLCCSWMCLHYRCLCCKWTSLHRHVAFVYKHLWI